MRRRRVRRLGLSGARRRSGALLGIAVAFATIACSSDAPTDGAGTGGGDAAGAVRLPPAPAPEPTVTAFVAPPDLDHYRRAVAAVLDVRANPGLTEGDCVADAVASGIGLERFERARADSQLVGRGTSGAVLALDPAERDRLRSELATAVQACDQLGRYVDDVLPGDLEPATIDAHRACLERSWAERVAEAVLAAFVEQERGPGLGEYSVVEAMVACPDAFYEMLVADHLELWAWSAAPDEACVRRRIRERLADPEQIRDAEGDPRILAPLPECGDPRSGPA